MYEAREVDGASVEAGCDTSEVFELVEAALNGIAELVGFEVVGDPAFSGWVSGDHRFALHVHDRSTQSVGIICLIRQNALR